MKQLYEWNTPQLYATQQRNNATNEFITLIGFLSFTQISSVFTAFPFILPAFVLSLIVYYRCELRMVFSNDQQSTVNSQQRSQCQFRAHNDF